MRKKRNVARQSFASLRGHFLAPDEGNFATLLSSLEYLHSGVRARYDLSFPRLTPPPQARRNNPQSVDIPAVGRNRHDVLRDSIEAFDDMIRWHHPGAMHNINAPVLIDAVAIKALTSLYNPNCLWDFVSGTFLRFEDAIIDQMISLFGWRSASADGVFTFGGKGTLLYAISIGANTATKQVSKSGLNGGPKQVVITSEAGHYSIEYACSFLGLGSENCIRVQSDRSGRMSAAAFEDTLDRCITAGQKVSCVILSGGSALDNVIDPIARVRRIIDRQSRVHSLDYKPHLHVDSVIGWLWLFFRSYDFGANVLAIPETALKRIRRTTSQVSEAVFADSVGVDFHKNGFCSYPASLFMAADRDSLRTANGAHFEADTVHASRRGDTFRQHYTIEHSRPGDGIMSAWVALQEIGVEGFQRYIAQMMSANQYVRDRVNLDQFEIVNPRNLGFAVLLYPRPPFYRRGVSSLPSAPSGVLEQVTDYCRRLFELIAVSPASADNPVVGYVPHHRAGPGCYAPVLRVYPMSPFTTGRELSVMLRRLSQLKMRFDKLYQRDQHELARRNSIYPR